MNKKMNNKGFSLVELIVVIAIMAVLVGVLAPQFIKYVESSRQSTDMQNIQQLKTAIEVECADKETTTDVTITVTKSTKKAEASMSLSTCGKEVNLKSAGWDDGVYTFHPSTGKWDVTNSVGTNAGGTDPKNMDTIFE